MKTLCWRFDDLTFGKKSSKYYCPLLIQKKIADIIDEYNCKATFGLITHYEGADFTSNPQYFRFIRSLHKSGHEIAAHCTVHTNWKKHSKKELKQITDTMRSDFEAMHLPIKTFIFPGLQTNWRALPILKQSGFDIIIKGENYNFIRKNYSLLRNAYYARRYGINFFVPHTYSTTENYDKPVLSLPVSLKSHLPITHVMDHIWLYNKENIKRFKDFVAKSVTEYKWKTIKMAIHEDL